MAADQKPDNQKPDNQTPDSQQPALTAAVMARAMSFDIALAESVVLVYDAGLVPGRSTKRHHQRSRHPFRQVGTLADSVDIVVAAGPGSPVAAITIEFLAALGVKRVIAVGSGGVLNGDIPLAHYVIGRAVSDEGTSAHYSDNLLADPALTRSLLTQLDGTEHVTLTTDVPFRHTPVRLADHRAQADVVEMETAAVFAAARRLGVHAAAVIVPSDRFIDTEWELLDNPIADASAAAIKAAVAVFSELTATA